MRKLVLSALFLSAFPLLSIGQVTEGQWTYIVENGGATITASTATGAVTIPSVLGGYAVKIVGNDFLYTSIFGVPTNTTVTSVVFPSSVNRIAIRALGGCRGLTSITISNSVTSIGNYAFQDCTSLISIVIPNSVTDIGYGAFEGCISLVNVYLPARFADTYTNFGLTASQANFGITLTASCNSSEGTILVNPNKIPYEAGESVVVTATPKAGYLFGNWSGASTATTSSITLTMDARKSLTAIFIQDGRDNDGDGLTNYQESITYGTNPNQKDSNGDGVEDGHAVSMGYNPMQNFSALVAHPPTGLYTASQMQAMAIGDLVLTKNANGSFTLNYDIEQSADLQTWTPYQALSLPLTGLPTDKAFVRIKAKQ